MARRLGSTSALPALGTVSHSQRCTPGELSRGCLPHPTASLPQGTPDPSTPASPGKGSFLGSPHLPACPPPTQLQALPLCTAISAPSTCCPAGWWHWPTFPSVFLTAAHSVHEDAPLGFSWSISILCEVRILLPFQVL